MTNVTLTDRPADKVSAPVLVVMTLATGGKATVASGNIDPAVAEAVNGALEVLGATGTADEVVKLAAAADPDSDMVFEAIAMQPGGPQGGT